MWTVIGHNKNKQYFESVIKNGRLGHAYLFTGPEMIGKKIFVQDIITMLSSRPFDSNPDFKSVFPKIAAGETKIYIEDIRELKSFSLVRPLYGSYKVILVDDADRLTAEASNALLKLLEEPHPSSVLFLTSSRPNLLLPTVVSRCQELKSNRLPDSDMIKFLPAKTSSEDRKTLIVLAGGRPGWLIRNAETISSIRKSIEEFDEVLDMGIFERMKYGQKIAERDDNAELINTLISWYYASDSRNFRLLKKLLDLSKTISQPQHNHRLAIENFLINV